MLEDTGRWDRPGSLAEETLALLDKRRPGPGLAEYKEEGVGGPEEDVEQPQVHVVVIPVIGQTSVSVLHHGKSIIG